MQQIFGGTLERYLTESIQSFLSPSSLSTFLSLITPWIITIPAVASSNDAAPDNASASVATGRDSALRSFEVRQRLKNDLERKMAFLLPDMVGSIVGGGNAKRGAVRLVAMVQNQRLNRELLYRILDRFISAMMCEV